MNGSQKIIALFVTSFVTSCVSLKTPNRTDHTQLTAPMALGKYPVKVDETVPWKNKTDTVITRTVWHHFENPNNSYNDQLDQATHIELQLVDNHHLEATLFNRNNALRNVILTGKLKNGYFRFKHDFSMIGVPPFYWRTSSTKKQIGIGKKGQLFIDRADETNGGLLIVTAGTPGFTRSLTVNPYK
ncbi:hypothetical protein [Pedobacter gandavensis]|uniref:hypothetical protein n=1 Tax=Pedobacter gandavensis TaxID=2679963 RepID=UPI00292EC329|nr:hypothetical protein [Pedobacter gandavensis]